MHWSSNPPHRALGPAMARNRMLAAEGYQACPFSPIAENSLSHPDALEPVSAAPTAVCCGRAPSMPLVLEVNTVGSLIPNLLS